jgi:hypothetical protein
MQVGAQPPTLLLSCDNDALSTVGDFCDQTCGEGQRARPAGHLLDGGLLFGAPPLAGSP